MKDKCVLSGLVAGLLWTVLAAVVAVGCAAHRDDVLQASVKAYNKAMKWQEYEKAGDFVAGSYKDQFRKATADFEKDRLKIVDYEIVRSTIDQEKDSATSTVKLEYYWEGDGKLLRATLDEKWVYEDGNWRIVPSLDEFAHK
ncbi:MAG: hypothetical protein HY788_11795 [Deltaproteobacteria bacterium]|nr:hypothetical protein [Deltaproteobacteria bacterium]